MFKDYRDRVMLTYEKKKEAPGFSSNLLSLTPAKLRTECLHVYQKRYLRKDENILASFFAISMENETGYGPIIKSFDVDKFRPLIKFLKKETNDTDIKNIELLAWLIDFEPRPYLYGSIYKKEEEIEVLVKTIIDEKDNTHGSKLDSGRESAPNETVEDKVIETDKIITLKLHTDLEAQDVEEVNIPKKKRSKSIIQKAIFSLAIILTASGGTYLFSDNGPQQCMYWTGDRYQAVSCNKKIDNTTIIALDTAKLNHLERITEPDTLTANSLGKVWYTKVDGEPEFYTSAGYHPLDENKRLMPITVYMLNKWVRRK